MFGLTGTEILNVPSATWLTILLDAAIKGTILILIVSLGIWARRRSSAADRSYIWSLTVGGLLILPLISLFIPIWKVPILPDLSTVGTQAAIDKSQELDSKSPAKPRLPVEEEIAERIKASNLEKRAETSQETDRKDYLRDKRESRHERSTESKKPEKSQEQIPTFVSTQTDEPEAAAPISGSSVDWIRLLFTIWGAGSLLVLTWLLVGKAVIWWIRRHSFPLADKKWDALLKDVSSKVGITGSVTLLGNAVANVAITSGIRNPVIILPEMAKEWDDERRRVVLLHELAHIKRRDTVVDALSHLVIIFYWFNPLVWLAVRQLRRERERACDDAVLTSGTKPSSYAFHLMEVAKDMSLVKKPLWQTATISQGSSLKDRLLCILNPNLLRGQRDWFASALAALLIIFIVVPLAAFYPWASSEKEISELQIGGFAEDLKILITDLQSDDAIARAKAAYKIEKIGPKAAEAIPHLINILDDERQVDPVDIGYKSNSWGPNGQYWYTTPGREAAEALEDIGDAAVNPLLNSINNENTIVRKRSIYVLGEIGDSRALQPIIGGLQDDTSEVRQTAAWALGEMENRQAVEALRTAINDPDARVREAVIWALAELEDRQSTSAFAQALQDQDKEVRKAAADALSETAQQGDDSVIDALIAALKDQDSEVREIAAHTLGELEDPRAVPALIAILNDPDADVREHVVYALEEIGDRRAVEPLRALIKDKSSDVREAVIHALCEFEDPQSTSAFIEALQDENSEIREAAVHALGELESQEAVPALIEALKDSDEEVREYAVHALEEIGDIRAVGPLRAMLKDESSEVREAAIHALTEFEDPQSTAAFIEALKDENPEIREAAVHALGELESSEAVPALIEALKDSDEEVREYAVHALEEIGDRQAVEPLRGMLTDKSADVREAAIHALTEFEDPQAASAYIAALKDENSEIREAAAHALGEIENREAVPALIAALKDPNSEVREAAAHALGHIGDNRAIAPLKNVLANDTDSEVRRAAAHALADLL